MTGNNILPGFQGQTPAAIYVHWPFCLKKCPYCDFNSHVRDVITHDVWLDAYLTEIKAFSLLYPNLAPVSIFFGGGTPSLMEAETVAAIIDAIKSAWPRHAPDMEITLEANPSSVEAAKFKAFAKAGVNRVSVGIQSLRDDALKFLGRLHSAKEAINALDVARDNFDRVSFDLIYARPDHCDKVDNPANIKAWADELKDALAFGPSHLSLYQLTIEEGTAFYHQFHRGKFQLPDEELSLALFETTQDITEAAGLPAYEVSNHARPGQESRHNLAYWQGLPYVGIGPGAHGRLPAPDNTATAHNQIKRPEDWLDTVKSKSIGLESSEHILADDRAIENIMMGLRLKGGIHLDTNAISLVNTDQLKTLQGDGYINFKNNNLSLTRKGMPLLNHILGCLIA